MSFDPLSSGETLFLDSEQDLQWLTSAPAQQSLQEHSSLISAKDDGNPTPIKRARNTMAARKSRPGDRPKPGYKEWDSETATLIRNETPNLSKDREAQITQTAVQASDHARQPDIRRKT